MMAYQIQYHSALDDGSVEDMVNRRRKGWELVSVAPVVVNDRGHIESYLVTWRTEDT